MHYRHRGVAILIRAPALALALSLTMLAAAGCAAAYRWDAGHEDPAKDQIYTVRSGDTLYSIAWRYGLDYRELATHNGIGSDFMIYPGQDLDLVNGAQRVSKSIRRREDAAATSPVNVSPIPSHPMPRGAWQWPVKGALVAKFGDPNATGKGIAIGGELGEAVLASADGKVVYAGSGLIGYGKIIIVKHSEEYLSAYGHNETIYVQEGAEVRQGDRIASVGLGPNNRPLLHFEIRINGKAVDPLKYLPSR